MLREGTSMQYGNSPPVGLIATNAGEKPRPEEGFDRDGGRAAPRLGHAMIRGDEAGGPFELQPEPPPRARRAPQPAQRDGCRQACARDAVGDESFTLGAA